jgi:uncharacterized protein (DUF1800 family)
MARRSRALGLASALLLMLSACGGGGGGGSSSSPVVVPPASISVSDAARFITQATYGVTDADISAVQGAGYSAWIDQQIGYSQQSAQSYVETRLTQLQAANPKATLGSSQFYEFYWSQAATGQDQLRERVKLALSEIFVVSFADPSVDVRGMASYWDMLGNNAFVNFRTLLENVTLHPMMGVYLTSLGNQKEDPTTGRHPDENYAREVMQLMTIGLYQLNSDGTQKLDSNGKPIPTYSSSDISDLAKVFTGISYYSPSPTNSTFFGGNRDPNAYVQPMIFYNQYHSVSQKQFLGTTIAASSTADTAGDLKIALDTLFNHPNVGPFISRRLIQSLVTSNPSAAYIGRVAAVFNNNGSGVRGDMAAVVKAVLTDAEARDATQVGSATSGKLREPMVRLGNWMRSFGASSASGNWLVGSTTSSTVLNQSALTAPSVFNFWRPGYVPPNSKLGSANLVAPEFQGVDEVTVAGYLNTIQGAIERGIGSANDVTSGYANELALGSDSGALLDRVNKLLFYGQMSATLRQRILDAVNSIAVPGGTATQAQINAALLQRVKLAVFLSMASGEYLAQR